MIKGQRIVLRSIEEEDLGRLKDWLNDAEMAHWVGGWTFPVSDVEQRAWFQRSLTDRRNRRFIVALPDGEVIGLTGLWEIDWHNRNALTALKLGPEAARGRGLGTDAIMTMCAYAFAEVGLHRLWTEILAYNRSSYEAYVRKCGWTVEGRLRQQIWRHGQFHDQLRVGILASEFAALALARPYLAHPDVTPFDATSGRQF